LCQPETPSPVSTRRPAPWLTAAGALFRQESADRGVKSTWFYDHEFVKMIKIAFSRGSKLRGTAPNNFNQWLLLGGFCKACAEFYTK
jgi:hypothetical protein